MGTRIAEPAGDANSENGMAASEATAAPRPVRLRRAALAALGFAAAFALLYAGALPCIFARMTHHPCPGCGSTRAVLALLHGDLHGVFANNPFGPAVALLLGFLGAQVLVSIVRWGDIRDAASGRVGRIMKRLILLFAVLEAMLWIARFLGMFGGPVSVAG